MNRPYELLVIFKAAGTEAELTQAAKQVEEPIRKLGGRLDHSSSWGRRRLAYRIARQQEGVYHLFQFHLGPEQTGELKRLLRLHETIVRFLLLNRENSRSPAGHPFDSAQGGRPERESRGGHEQADKARQTSAPTPPAPSASRAADGGGR